MVADAPTRAGILGSNGTDQQFRSGGATAAQQCLRWCVSVLFPQPSIAAWKW
jgi:hypothetical protein